MTVAGTLSREALAAWQAVADADAPWLMLDCLDGSDDHVAPREVSDGDRVRVTLTYAPQDGAEHLFTPEGWRSLLLDADRACRVSTVRLAFLGAPDGFRTRGHTVEPWIDAPARAPIQDPRPEAGPRRVVRSQSPELMAPPRIEPYVAGAAKVEGPAALAWREAAGKMIALSLPNELYRDGATPMAMLAGQPPRKLVLGDGGPGADGFDAQQAAAAWVYLEGADVEVRHTFLSAELSREWTAGESFRAGLPKRIAPALDSARLLYKAHLRAGSKDTLKALSDLRKTLSDEVQKLLQQSRDLSAAVWRDVAVAIGALIVRLAIDAAKGGGSGGAGFAWLYVVVAAYVGISYAVSVSTNRRFLGVVEASRSAWRTKLYGFLDDADYDALADGPLAGAMAAYRRAEGRTTAVVWVVVFVMLATAAMEAGWIDPDALRSWLATAHARVPAAH
ncbi:hypothetical protein MBRA_04218 [Methylobacterium brachiatum]|nr:hypothetical protein MBRA_04218 [Methylobacterium brachiatum]